MRSNSSKSSGDKKISEWEENKRYFDHIENMNEWEFQHKNYLLWLEFKKEGTYLQNYKQFVKFQIYHKLLNEGKIPRVECGLDGVHKRVRYMLPFEYDKNIPTPIEGYKQNLMKEINYEDPKEKEKLDNTMKSLEDLLKMIKGEYLSPDRIFTKTDITQLPASDNIITTTTPKIIDNENKSFVSEDIITTTPPPMIIDNENKSFVSQDIITTTPPMIINNENKSFVSEDFDTYTNASSNIKICPVIKSNKKKGSHSKMRSRSRRFLQSKARNNIGFLKKSNKKKDKINKNDDN